MIKRALVLLVLIPLYGKSFHDTAEISPSEARLLEKAARALQLLDFNKVKLHLQTSAQTSQKLWDCLGEFYLFQKHDIARAKECFGSSVSNRALFFLSTITLDDEEKRSPKKELFLRQNAHASFLLAHLPPFYAIRNSFPDFYLSPFENYCQQVISECEKGKEGMPQLCLMIAECNFYAACDKQKLSLFVGINGTYENLVPTLIIRTIATSFQLRQELYFFQEGLSATQVIKSRAYAYLALLYYFQKQFKKSKECLDKCASIHKKMIFPSVIAAELKLSDGQMSSMEVSPRHIFFQTATQNFLPSLQVHSIIRLGHLYAVGIGTDKNLMKARGLFRYAVARALVEKLDKDWIWWALIFDIECGAIMIRKAERFSTILLTHFTQRNVYYTDSINILRYALEIYKHNRQQSISYFGLAALMSTPYPLKYAAVAQRLGGKKYHTIESIVWPTLDMYSAHAASRLSASNLFKH